MVEPGRQFAKPPAKDQSQVFALQLGDRSFSGRLNNPAFLAVRLPAGSLDVSVDNPGQTPAERLVFTQLDQRDEVAAQFATFEAQIPRVGVHVGLRRDCGHTFRQVGEPQNSPSTDLLTYTFEGAINDYPRPDVQADNDNYLAGVREIAVRSEYTDGRDMPRLLIQRIEFEGPLVEQWPPATHQRIFIRSGNESDHPVYAREIIRSFATNAFRRPVRADEEEWLMEVWRNSYEAEPNFRQSIQDTLTVVLTSPQFLHLIEESSSPKHEDINDYELASKLAYFLWNGPPDEILLELAQNGTLRPELDHQLDRMMMSPHFRRFANEFTTQWLGMKKIDTVEFDIKKYPDLRQETITALQREPAELLLHLIRTNSSVRELVQSEQMVVNEITAQYYSVEKPINSGFDFVPVAHGSGNLGGLLSQAGILAGLSDGRESNPVKRGAWLARKIVGEPPEDPPPNVPALADDLTNLSLRERLERHRNQKGCVKCHLGIDPWGVPLEEFDAAGLFKNNAVDAKSTLPDNTEVASAAELKAYLAEERLDQVAFSFLKHLATYATGRDLGFNEIASLRRESLALRDQNYAMRELFRYIINSDLFLKK